MFPAHRARHQERQIVAKQPLVAVGGRVVCRSEVNFRPAHDTATDTEGQLPEIVVTQFVSPDDEHDVFETCTGKAVPLQAWSGPEGSRNLRFPDFMTTAQDDGKVVGFTHRPPLPPGNAPGTHFC